MLAIPGHQQLGSVKVASHTDSSACRVLIMSAEEVAVLAAEVQVRAGARQLVQSVLYSTIT